MSLTRGQRLGAYEIAGKLGEGGMGEVYRARDTRLDRDVALKTLPASLADDPDRLMRFEREAKTLASLNHPNIAGIFGFEEFQTDQASSRALVMELVEGEDLSERLSRGALPVPDALAIASQMADALEAAHEHGVIHRDLKPANIKIRHDGTIKILDFGLAKAVEGDGSRLGGQDGSPSNSPTLTARATQLGMIIGTAAYMSPEQARGKSVDRRADIWAFGVVLYEMLTGRRLFEGEEISDVLAAVLRQEVSFAALPPETPAPVRRLLRRCLAKDPKRRLSAIGDARLELTEPDEAESAGAVAAPVQTPGTMMASLGGAALATLVGAGLWLAFGRAPAVASGEIARLTVMPPEAHDFYPDPAESSISPDGRWVAMVTGDITSLANTVLWVRPIDDLTPRRVEGGDGAHMPFWSPDSRRIGFFAEGRLKTVAVEGGRVAVVCDASSGRGGTWNRHDLILFSPDGAGPLFRVPAGGGTPVAVTTLDESAGETGHRFPEFLPDGEQFIYASLPGRGGMVDVWVGSLTGGERQSLGSFETGLSYVAPGWVVFARQGGLAARAFDPGTRTLGDDIVTLDDTPGGTGDPATAWTGAKAATASATGTLAYLKEANQTTRAVWIDAAGRVAGTLELPRALYLGSAISPDGTRAAIVRQMSRTESTLHLLDLNRETLVPLSTGSGANSSPIWSPDSRKVVFASDRDGPASLYVQDVTSGGREALLYASPAPFKTPTSWSPDGSRIVFNQLDPETFQNQWSVAADGTGEPTLLVTGPYREVSGVVSPDSRWLAYLADDSANLNLYVTSFPVTGPPVAVTTTGALFAWWRADGRQLVFVNAARTELLAVDVDGSGATFRAGTPRRLGQLPPDVVHLAAMPDRQRFLALVRENPSAARSIALVTNWTRAVTERARHGTLGR